MPSLLFLMLNLFYFLIVLVNNKFMNLFYRSKSRLYRLLIFFSILLSLIFLIDPFNSVLIINIVPFILIFFIFRDVLILFFELVLRLKKSPVLHGLASYLAFIPVLLLILSSLNQLTIRDVLVSLSLLTISGFYISRARFLSQ